MKCLNCQSESTMLMGDTKVVNGQIVTEDCCLTCGICYREFVKSNKTTGTTTAERMRATFTNHGKFSKNQMIELKCRDRTLYIQWLTMLEHLDGTLTTQKEGTYSEHASHFLHIMQMMIRYMESHLERRIRLIDTFLKGE